MAALSLVFNLLANNQASGAFNEVGRDAEKTGGKLGKLGGAAKGLGLAAGGVALGGIAALAVGLKQGADEFSGNQVAAAQLTATLKSTGGAAKTSTASVVALADSIEAKTGTDGAAVVSGAALLATFTKVRNEAGKGNDVFNRATQAGVDLAAKGFGSVESNAVLLGKALNDPIKGLSALGKQGVQFTAGQKATIASLVATGDTLGAQKIILKEIEGQVGGSAAAYGQTLPGQLARASAAFDGVKETVFKAFLPVLSSALEFVNARLLPAFGRFATFIGPAFSAVGAALGRFFGSLSAGGAGPVSQLGGFLRTLGVTLRTQIVPAVTAAARSFAATALPAIRAVAGFIVTNVLPVARGLAVLFATVVLPAVVRLAGVIATNLRAALQTISQKIAENRPQLAALAGAFRSVVTFVAERVVPLLGPVIARVFKNLGETIGTAITVIGRIVTAFTTVRDKVNDAKARFGEFKTALERIRLPEPIRRIGEIVEKIAGGVGGAAKGVARFFGVGDGPGKPRGGFTGGNTLARVKGLIPAGAYVTNTYRDPATNRRVGGSPTSYHLDRQNPAVDIGGSPSILRAVYARLAAIGGWRELLGPGDPGHSDHVHVAHNGGTVSSSWPRMPGDRSDERTARLQVGERVLSRREVAAGSGTPIVNHFHGVGPDVERAVRQPLRELAFAMSTGG